VGASNGRVIGKRLAQLAFRIARPAGVCGYVVSAGDLVAAARTG